MKTFFFLFFAALFSLQAQNTAPVQSFTRPFTSLNGDWHIIIDPYEGGFYDYRYEAYEDRENPPKNAFFTNTRPADKTALVEYDFDASETLSVPGDWNTQKEKLLYYEGTIWYKKSFDYTRREPASRVFVRFGAANYQADVYLNGQKLGRHVGGFTPFGFEITPLLKEKDNFLIVKVDNKRYREAVPTLNTDWWNYGGLTQDVRLLETPETYIDDYLVQLNPKDSKNLKGYIRLSGPDRAGQQATLEIPELKFKTSLKTNDQGVAELSAKFKRFQPWSPENPKRYAVVISSGKDTVEDRIGFRTIRTSGTQILLNDKPVFLKGICIHEESPISGGRAKTVEDAKKLLSWVKELNGNYVRLAHYPHNEYMIRTADEMGILVWEENPVYWTIQWSNPETFENAKRQLTEVIQRDKNRASVIIWSMANETPVGPERLSFLKRLATHARSLDGTRLISAALEQTSLDDKGLVRTIEDPFADHVDVLSFNQYVGWYDGLPSKAREIRWEIDQQKPILVSEFGAGAKFGYHGDLLTRWSEEYQESLYQESLKMLDRIEGLSGMSPWLLMDFRSPRRPLAKIQDGYNRKGLLDEKGNKKKAFYTLQQYYAEKQPN